MDENITINAEENGTGETVNTTEKTAEELIVVKQLPIIVEQLQSISAKIKESTEYALSLEVTEDNYKAMPGASIALICERLTFAFSESCSCDIPRILRSVDIAIPN